MENNEIMNNEEVMEVTEEIVRATSNGGFKKVTTIGLAMLAGGLACKFIVEPAVAKFKNRYEDRKAVIQHMPCDFDYGEDYDDVENNADSE